MFSRDTNNPFVNMTTMAAYSYIPLKNATLIKFYIVHLSE